MKTFSRFFSLICALTIVLSANAVQKEATDVTISSYSTYHQGTYDELSLDGDYASFDFFILFGDGASHLQTGKTYTIDDILVDSVSGRQYGAIYYNNSWHEGLKAFSLVKTIDEAGLVHFVGSATDSLDASFTFHYDEEPYVPTGDTVTYFIHSNVDMSYYSYYNMWTVDADDRVYGFALEIFANDATPLQGTYTSDDFDLNYTYAKEYTDGEQNKIFARSAAANIYVEGDATCVDVTIVGEDSRVYKLSARSEPNAILQAIENTDAAVQATKRFANGQLVIEKNGVQYNAIGTIVK